MIWLSIPVAILGLLCLVGSRGHMVGADQLLITDHIIASVQQAPAQLPTQMNSLPMNMEPQEPSESPDMVTDLHRSLRFEPPKLDFGAWSIGMAQSHTVTLVNQNTNRSVYLSSVSGRTPAFYSSFFEAKVVPPQGNTTFNVVFLPCSYGAVTTSLLVHTSFGQAKLPVKGEGRECPYRLKPFVGVKAPLNCTLTPEVQMYNPHGHPLQIMEVYSSGGQFQLELPSGGQEGPQTLWEIPSYSSKSVIRIRFHGSKAGNHTAYVRIKISDLANNSTDTNENVLVIPIEFEIQPNKGLYAENPFVDFGRLTTRDKVVQLKVELKHSTDQKQHDVVKYTLREIPGLTFNMKELTVSLDPQQFAEDTRIEELLAIRVAAKRNASEIQEFSVLIRGEVFKGGMAYDKNTTVFVTNSKEFISGEWRPLVVTNEFMLPVSILNVSVEDKIPNIFNIQLNSTEVFSNLTINPGDSAELLKLQLLDDKVTVRTILNIYTNVTTISVPLMVYSGRLHVQTMDSEKFLTLGEYNTEMDLGIIHFSEMSHFRYVVLQNRNPISIEVKSWNIETPQGVYYHTKFMGCLRAAPLKSLMENGYLPIDSTKFKFCSHLAENDVALYVVSINSYTTEERVANFKISTPHETINVVVKFKTWIGKLEVDQEQLYFKNCFPGKLCFSDLSIRSTLLKPIRISSLNFTDAGLTFKDFDPDGSWIAPDATTKVGRIYFEPAKLCTNRCYIQQDGKSNAIAFPEVLDWKLSPGNFNFVDTELRKRTELFRHLKWYLQTISFSLRSNELREFELYLIIDIEWPKLVSGKQTMPTIEVGKTQNIQVMVTNPATHPILIDFFLSDPKYSQFTQLYLPLEVVDVSTNRFLTDKDVFRLPGGSPAKPVLLPPGASMPINVHFAADHPDTYSTLLHIRNNLTLYEAVWITSKTVQSQFKFGNRKPGSSTPLLFEVNEKHLTSCMNSNREYANAEHLAVVSKRTFTARNTGEIPILIDSFLIGDQTCEGFGFKILDCSSFELKANSSKKIEIVFSPDFTSARVSRPLILKTNLSYDVNYLLLAIMPPMSLDQCSELLPRPQWEQRIKNVALVLLATTFVFVLIAAHIDYGNVLLTQSALYMSRDKGPVHPTFNLRNIAVKSQAAPAAEQQQIAQSTQRPNNRVVAQQQKTSGNNNTSNLKKRNLKKVNSNGSGGVRNMSFSDITWPLDLSGLKEAPVKGANTKNVQTFSERSFKLKLEADKSAEQSSANSSTSVSSSESSAKSSPPKAVEKRVEVQTAEKELTSASSGNKKQKNPKKAKNITPATSNEKVDKETERTVLTQKPVNKSPKQNHKTICETPSPSTNNTKSVIDCVKPIAEFPTPETSVVAAASKQITSSSNETAAPGRKYGKTPGRERKKEPSGSADVSGTTAVSSSSSSSSCSVGSKRSERKQKNKATNALNFNSSPSPVDTNETNMFNSISSPWDTSSQVSFSHVLQSQKNPKSTSGTSSASGDFGLEMQADNNATHEQLVQMEVNEMVMNNDLKQQIISQQQQELFNTYNKTDNFPSGELGPIGSKKSPSTTPVWEPLAGIPATHVQTIPKPTLSNNSSFFSNLMPAYGYNENQQYTGLPSGLYELKKAQEELRQWQTNEYLFNLRQQQLHAQQQQLQAMEARNNWPMSSQTWTPMGYGQNAVNTTAPSNANGGISLVPWHRPTPIRPPPGLEQNFPNQVPTTQQQQQLAQQTSTNIPSTVAPPRASISGDDVQSMQTFDPFSSLSSIWSENWNQNNRNDMN